METHDQHADQMVPTVLVNRSRRASAEARRDIEVLRFVGRFRFVTDELLAVRFGVRRQQMNARVRRLAAAGLLERSGGPAQPRLAMLTRKGAQAVGLPLRRAARTTVQREHELALVWLVIQLERAGDARRSALEFELSAKGTTRLQSIVDAYAFSPTFDEVIFLVADVSIARRLARAVRKAPQPVLGPRDGARRLSLRVVPWPGLTDDQQRSLAAVIAEH